MRNFADRLTDLIDELGSPVCVGLDPRLDDIPKSVKQEAIEEYGVQIGEISDASWGASARAIELFNKKIIDATFDVVPAYKPQIAFYEPFKHHGIKAFEETARYARSKGRIVIVDAKRNDIADTAQAYANAYLGEVELITGAVTSGFNVDALTVNPYLGSDGLKPFIEVCKRDGKGIFVLDKTSNPSSVELQDLKFDEKHGGRKLYEQVALKMEILGRDLLGERGYSSVGLVVGASGNTPEELRNQATRIRKLNSSAIILVPGYGQQGGTAKDVVASFNREGYGAIVNNSRGIIFAYKNEPFKSNYKPENFDEAARDAAVATRDDIASALREAGFRRWVK